MALPRDSGGNTKMSGGQNANNADNALVHPPKRYQPPAQYIDQEFLMLRSMGTMAKFKQCIICGHPKTAQHPSDFNCANPCFGCGDHHNGLICHLLYLTDRWLKDHLGGQVSLAKRPAAAQVKPAPKMQESLVKAGFPEFAHYPTSDSRYPVQPAYAKQIQPYFTPATVEQGVHQGRKRNFEDSAYSPARTGPPRQRPRIENDRAEDSVYKSIYEGEKQLRESLQQQLADSKKELAESKKEAAELKRELANLRSGFASQAMPTPAHIPPPFNWQPNYHFAAGGYPSSGTMYGFAGYPTNPMSMQGLIPPATSGYSMANAEREAFRPAQAPAPSAALRLHDTRKVEATQVDDQQPARDLSQAINGLPNECEERKLQQLFDEHGWQDRYLPPPPPT